MAVRLLAVAAVATAWIGVNVAAARAASDADEPTHPKTVSRSGDKPSGAVAVTSCHGREKQWTECKDLPSCDACTPVACEFTTWSEWSVLGGCSGLCQRERRIARPNNGCGTPCAGPKKETAQMPACLEAKCASMVQKDCKFGPWSTWDDCSSDADQRKRTRQVAHEAEEGGLPCIGASIETEPCHSTSTDVVDCELSEWTDQTACSKTCGGGLIGQGRKIVKHASRGGALCDGPTARTRECGTEPCGRPVDCLLGEWTPWEGCTAGSPNQKQRSRKVERHASNDGKACSDILREVAACPVASPVPCHYSAWSAWSPCTAKCDGGSSMRNRTLTQEPVAGGACEGGNLKELKACNIDPCHAGKDCRVADWEDWGACSTTCGEGSRIRSRKVAQLASAGGKGCAESLREAARCQVAACTKADCVWSDWDEWSGCTCTCGGGTRHRNRRVRTAPLHGGKPCEPKDKSEVAPCNTESCERCVDALWGPWSPWSRCSATCAPGALRMRHREIVQTANHCGKPAVGVMDEYMECSDLQDCVVSYDCLLSSWGMWSSCSCSCFGVRERLRSVVRYASGPAGRPCVDSTKDVQPCSPGPHEKAAAACGSAPPRACQLSEWYEWGPCSSTCGGGYRKRSRQILTPSSNDGEPCGATLEMAGECNTQRCGEACRDCEWHDWTDWGACSHCGGQRWRHRFVKTLPNDCGKLCEPGHAKEVETCKSPCKQKAWCAWDQWSDFGPCSAVCGSATNLRQRQLSMSTTKPPLSEDILFEGLEDMTCAGVQVDINECKVPKCYDACTPVDCKFADWSDWADPTCLQLCQRHRGIAQTSSCGGTVCSGAQVETKRCTTDCTKPKDCKLSLWSEWSSCRAPHPRFRSRRIMAQSANGGKVCSGDLEEMKPCSSEGEVMSDCAFSAWSLWSDCTSDPCRLAAGGERRTRTRSFRSEVANGGEACMGMLSETTDCSLLPLYPGECSAEAKNCKLSAWSEWGSCGNGEACSEEDPQQCRERTIVDEGNLKGDPCTGSLREMEPCGRTRRDCSTSQWTEWGDCDEKCGGGQRLRRRTIEVEAKHGGKPCPSVLQEVAGCNDSPCEADKDLDCSAGPWSDWSSCKGKCGTGQKARQRSLNRAHKGGMGCTTTLSMTAPCDTSRDCGVKDCRWSDWKDWSDCSRSCDGGQRTRRREIQEYPAKGGALCEAQDSEVVEPCNTDACQAVGKCIDGAWSDWFEWQDCSRTCHGGLKSRERVVARTANECGKPLVGQTNEFAQCNVNVSCAEDIDCSLTDWTQWSGCSARCDGVHSRSRRIGVYGREYGAFCKGSLRQTESCTEKGAHCFVGKNLDCKLSEWGDWSDCTASCGVGQRQRSRDVERAAEGSGRPCSDEIEVTQPCDLKACPKDCEPVDCSMSEWSDWSCQECKGEKTRSRHIMTEASCGGEVCPAGSTVEVASCPRRCKDKVFCAWDNWEEWAVCSATCGRGVSFRTRDLAIVDKPAEALIGENILPGDHAADLEAGLERLSSQSKRIDPRRVQDVALAFACGCVTIVAVLFVVRLCASANGRRFVASSSMAGSGATGDEGQWLIVDAPVEQEGRAADVALRALE